MFGLSLNVLAQSATQPSSPNSTENSGYNRQQVVKKREQNQEKRIQEGVKSGELTTKEAQRLERKQAHIKKMEEKAMSDGKMTKGEFKHIENAQDRASHSIHRKKHNNRK